MTDLVAQSVSPVHHLGTPLDHLEAPLDHLGGHTEPPLEPHATVLEWPQHRRIPPREARWMMSAASEQSSPLPSRPRRLIWPWAPLAAYSNGGRCSCDAEVIRRRGLRGGHYGHEPRSHIRSWLLVAMPWLPIVPLTASTRYSMRKTTQGPQSCASHATGEKFEVLSTAGSHSCCGLARLLLFGFGTSAASCSYWPVDTWLGSLAGLR